jgi:hypothetical protein
MSDETKPPTAFEFKVLAAMIPGKNHAAAGLAQAVWPPPAGRYFGPKQGQNQRMGAILNRMKKKGLVIEFLSFGTQSLWLAVESRRPSSAPADGGTKGNWKIEYEIPPLRAIYFADADDCTESEARALVKKEYPLWRIRNVTPAVPTA